MKPKDTDPLCGSTLELLVPTKCFDAERRRQPNRPLGVRDSSWRVVWGQQILQHLLRQARATRGEEIEGLISGIGTADELEPLKAALLNTSINTAECRPGTGAPDTPPPQPAGSLDRGHQMLSNAGSCGASVGIALIFSLCLYFAEKKNPPHLSLTLQSTHSGWYSFFQSEIERTA